VRQAEGERHKAGDKGEEARRVEQWVRPAVGVERHARKDGPAPQRQAQVPSRPARSASAPGTAGQHSAAYSVHYCQECAPLFPRKGGAQENLVSPALHHQGLAVISGTGFRILVDCHASGDCGTSRSNYDPVFRAGCRRIRDFYCAHAKMWIAVKWEWNLAVNDATAGTGIANTAALPED